MITLRAYLVLDTLFWTLTSLDRVDDKSVWNTLAAGAAGTAPWEMTPEELADLALAAAIQQLASDAQDRRQREVLAERWEARIERAQDVTMLPLGVAWGDD